jgi:mono/diheme cytochrome c family protein
MMNWKLVCTAAVVALMQPHAVLAQNAPPPPNGASKQVLQGAQLYQQNCALCHGVSGRDANVFPRPIWGTGHDIAKFANAKGLFEYLQMLMPFDDPAKVNDAGKTAITSYMMVRNGNMMASETLPMGGNQRPIK